MALNKRQSNKFRAKGKEYIMIGYSDNCKGYRLYDEKNKKVIVSRDVVFIEKAQVSEESDTKIVDFDESELEDVILPINAVQLQHNHDDEIAGTEVMSSDHEEAVQDIDEVNIAEDSVVTSRGRGRPRLLRTGARGRPRKQYNELNLVHEDLEVIPNSAEEAFNSNHCSEWKAAMEKEYTALVKNGTWTLTDLPHGQKVVGCKWVYTIKRDKLGDIKQFKARLVAKGCSQRYGINYSETFSPVVRYANIRMVIALAVEHNLYLHQMDVSSAYLNSELHDDVYMQQPECFVDTKYPKQVLKLKKSYMV